MASKKSVKRTNKKSKSSKLTYALNFSTTKGRILIFTLIFAVIGTGFMAYQAFAAPRTTRLPTGTIALKDGSNLKYGGTVSFDTTVSGRMAPKGYLVISLVCVQDRNIVYQVSLKDLSAEFTLVDGAHQNLEWDGGPARCYGSLVYRIDGRNPTIEYLDQTVFEVN